MDILQDVLLLVLLIGGIILIGVLLYVLLSTRRAIHALTTDIRRLSEKTYPILEHLEEATRQSTEVLAMITENRDKITNAVENVRKVTENIYRLENTLQEQVEPGVIGLARRLAALRHGIDSFLENWRMRR